MKIFMHDASLGANPDASAHDPWPPRRAGPLLTVRGVRNVHILPRPPLLAPYSLPKLHQSDRRARSRVCPLGPRCFGRRRTLASGGRGVNCMRGRTRSRLTHFFMVAHLAWLAWLDVAWLGLAWLGLAAPPTTESSRKQRILSCCNLQNACLDSCKPLCFEREKPHCSDWIQVHEVPQGARRAQVGWRLAWTCRHCRAWTCVETIPTNANARATALRRLGLPCTGVVSAGARLRRSHSSVPPAAVQRAASRGHAVGVVAQSDDTSDRRVVRPCNDGHAAGSKCRLSSSLDMPAVITGCCCHPQNCQRS